MHRRLPRAAAIGAAAACTVLALTTGTATAASPPVSQATGYFLRGAVGGTDLATLVSLADAAAVNTGGPAVTVANPLAATVLDALTIPVGPINVPIGDATGLQLGVLEQYAQASPDGSAVASSGAVANNGAISAGGTTPATAGNLSLDLGKLASTSGLPAGLTTLLGTVGDLRLSAGALAGRATQAPFAATGAAGAQAGTYQIGSLTLDVAAGSGFTALTTALTGAATGLLTSLTGALPPGLVTFPAPATLLADLTDVHGAGFSANLVAGTLSLDLVALVEAATGKNINALPPGTELLPLITAALPGIATAIATAVTSAGSTFVASLGALTVAGQPLPLGQFLGTFGALTAGFPAALSAVTTQFASALGTLGTALSQLLDLTANVQSTAGGQFTETALQLALLPSGVPGGAATPAALLLGLGNAAVGPGTPLVATPTPTPTAPSPTTSTPMLANTGPTTLRDATIGVWTSVAGLALLIGAGRTVRQRRTGAHRAH